MTKNISDISTYGYEYYNETVNVSSNIIRSVSFKSNGLNHSIPQEKALKMLGEIYAWEELAKIDENFAKQLDQLRIIYKLSLE